MRFLGPYGYCGVQVKQPSSLSCIVLSISPRGDKVSMFTVT